MSFFRKLVVGVLLVAGLSGLLPHLLEAPSFLVTLALSLVVGGLGALVMLWMLPGEIDKFLKQFRAVSESVTENGSPARMDLYPDPALGRAARQFNELVDAIEDRRAELREELNKFESILDELSDGVIAVDADAHVLYLNEMARDLLEILPDEDSSESPLVSELTRDDTVQVALNSCLETGESVHEEGKRVAPDREINLTVDASPLTDSEDQVIGAVAAIHDVTELHRLRTVRQDFVANVSHELKTPITAIQGFIETLADDGDVDPGTRDRFIRKIRDQVKRMSAMVEDLLTISKLESDEGVLESKRMNVVDPIQQALETIRPGAENKGVSVETKLPDDPLYVSGDPAGLRQVVTNLLDNAVKYTPAEGRVSLRVDDSNSTVTVEVEDTGIGIEPRKQDRVFERFYRVDTGRSRDQGGTGLGLAIVKHLVLTMDGEIDVESTPGQGSLFRVILPKG